VANEALQKNSPVATNIMRNSVALARFTVRSTFTPRALYQAAPSSLRVHLDQEIDQIAVDFFFTWRLHAIQGSRSP
jgi:hypothetical protein